MPGNQRREPDDTDRWGNRRFASLTVEMTAAPASLTWNLFGVSTTSYNHTYTHQKKSVLKMPSITWPRTGRHCVAVRFRLAALIIQLQGGTKQLLQSRNRLTHSFRHKTHTHTGQGLKTHNRSCRTHLQTLQLQTMRARTHRWAHKAFGRGRY